MTWLLELPIIDGPLPWIVWTLSAVAFVYLLARPPRIRWVLTALIGLLAGALVAFATIWVVEAFNLFGVPLTVQTDAWVVVTFAAIGLAVVNLWRSRWWRKVVAAVGAVLFALSGTLGINAYFGLKPTVASFLGIVVEHPIDINRPTGSPTPRPTDDPDAGRPVYETWTPPADMPATGTTGTQVIPATASGFSSRPAGIYLPPAAQVADPPDLPLMILMMGQPGDPDPQYVASVLDEYAAAHQGLAPIVIVADQLGDESIDPVCADTAKYGNAETFIVQDVVAWARANLRIDQDPAHWVIAGYSNGGGCAFKYGAEYPELWENVLSISGEEYPGSEDPSTVIDQLFGGDAAAFEATKPASILASGAHAYPDTVGIFTVGGADPVFIPAAQAAAAAAQAAGWQTTYYVIPDAGHVLDALHGGFEKGFEILYPRLGLAAPAS
ncbi:alpha/beta hydrolase-fold protein [Herbiconiux moechotypicola]|uniref:Alpha/beta hydrolase-fold protein n=1 Tax=Herbiconiux moechotypicola TaxID=637393 RepID=A0ABN3DC74_9MICO|nr:alpha/beta hydrolase-fold protein [Herbiconiux moechotypicola]MCS5728752.1 alpha/beta hydrolase-fold protein [Herbiconiux moechotypicola]